MSRSKLLGKLYSFVGVALLLCAAFSFTQRYLPNRLAFSRPTFQSSSVASEALPVELLIPSLNLDLPITSLPLTNNNWPTVSDSLVYVSNTPLPGTLGNSVIYGHNWPNILGSLHKIKPGSLITIKSSTGATTDFQVEFVSVVSPNETHILNPTTDHRLTLYTCTGFLDSKRLVVTAISR